MTLKDETLSLTLSHLRDHALTSAFSVRFIIQTSLVVRIKYLS